MEYTNTRRVYSVPVAGAVRDVDPVDETEYFVCITPTGKEVLMLCADSKCTGTSTMTGKPCINFVVKGERLVWCSIVKGVLTPDGNKRAVASSPTAVGGGAVASSPAAVGGGAVASSPAAVGGGTSTSSHAAVAAAIWQQQQWWLQQQQQQFHRALMPMPLHFHAGGSATTHHVHAPTTEAAARHGGAGGSATTHPVHVASPAPIAAFAGHGGAGVITTAAPGPLVEYKPPPAAPTLREVQDEEPFWSYIFKVWELKYLVAGKHFDYDGEVITIKDKDKSVWIPCNLDTHSEGVQCGLPHLTEDGMYAVPHCHYDAMKFKVCTKKEKCWHFHDKKEAASAHSGGAAASAPVPPPTKVNTFAEASKAGLGGE